MESQSFRFLVVDPLQLVGIAVAVIAAVVIVIRWRRRRTQ
jgi:hypothetical protein